MPINIYGPEQQAVGEFDGGKLVEQKPIGFPREGSEVSRVGPLFYWAWFHSNGEGHIPMHPHQAFEIMTYVIAGQAEHGDSLGTRSVVGPGGAQVMQTGSGVYHEERGNDELEGFQIWFEPHLNEALKKQPTYHQYEHEQFPITEQDGVTVKTVIGEEAPIRFEAEARMWDVTIPAGGRYAQPLRKGYSLAMLAIRGGGAVDRSAFRHKDFIVLQPEDAQEAAITADAADELRIVIIEVPARVNYPLYRQ